MCSFLRRIRPSGSGPKINFTKNFGSGLAGPDRGVVVTRDSVISSETPWLSRVRRPEAGVLSPYLLCALGMLDLVFHGEAFPSRYGPENLTVKISFSMSVDLIGLQAILKDPRQV